MKFKKIFKYLFCSFLVLSSCGLTRFNSQEELHNHIHFDNKVERVEEASPRVFTELDFAKENESIYVPIRAEFLSCAAIEIEVRYDSRLFSSSWISLYNNVDIDSSKNESFIYNTNTPGTISATYVFNGNRDLNQTLFYFYITPNEVEEETSAYIDVSVGKVIDKNLNDVNVKSSGSRVIIQNSTSLKTGWLNVYLNKNTLEYNDVLELSISVGSYSIAMGEFKIEYDPEYFEFTSYQLCNPLNGVSTNINKDIKGAVFFNFASTRNIETYYDLIKIRFKAIKNESSKTELITSLTNAFTETFEPIGFNDNKQEITFNYVLDESKLPSIYSSNYEGDIGINFNIDIYLESNMNLGAGDFELTFSSTILKYVKHVASDIPNGFVTINTQNSNKGKIKLSVLSTTGINEETKVASLTFVSNTYIKEDVTTTIELKVLDSNDYLTNHIDVGAKNSTVSLKKHVHTFGDWVETIHPTCEEDGLKRRTCLTCDLYEEEVLPKLGHKESDWLTLKEATCEEDGKRVKKCVRCDEILQEEIINKLGHSYSDWFIESEATCEKEGIKVKTCSKCNDKITTIIPALNHINASWIETKAPTVEEDGEEQLICPDCNKVLETRVIPKGEHVFSEWIVTKEPTCSELGLEERTCSHCDLIETRNIPMVPHYGEIRETIKEPSCIEKGKKILKCKYCDVILEEEEIPFGEHVLGEWEITKEPTCLENGLKTQSCTHCGEVINSEVIESTGHNYGDWVIDKDSTCTEVGSKHHTCSSCNHEEREEIPLKEHNGKWQVTKEPTETEEGVESLICENCGKMIDTKPIPKLKDESTDNSLILGVTITSSIVGVILIALLVTFIIIKKKKSHK